MSGLLLAFLIPAFIFTLAFSLRSEDSFNSIHSYLTNPLCKIMMWGFLSALLYHLLAGVRHMIMDFGFGESVCGATISSWFLFILAAFVSVLIGVWLW